MAVTRANGAPLGIGSAGDVLDLLQPFLYVGLKVRTRLHYLPAQRIARIDSQHRLHVQVLAPLQKLQQPHAVAGVVAPGGRVGRAVDQRADHLLPVETGFDPVAFEIIAAREPQKTRGAWRPAFPSCRCDCRWPGRGRWAGTARRAAAIASRAGRRSSRGGSRSEARRFRTASRTCIAFHSLPAIVTFALARTWPDWSATSAIRTGSASEPNRFSHRTIRCIACWDAPRFPNSLR